jgi:L-fuconolactonase
MDHAWIDSHHHLWQYNAAEYPWMSARMQSLQRDFSVQELSDLALSMGVHGTIAVQARQSIQETEYLLDLADTSSLLRGVVGWMPLVDPLVELHLERFSQRAKLKGVRHVLHDELDPFYMLRSDFNRGISKLEAYGLRYDLLIFSRHLPQTLKFVDMHPNLIFIVDHIAKPEIASGEIATWRRGIQLLSEREHVFCKLSGMVTEADWGKWTRDELQPYFETVFSAFGPSRLMFGSDWPVLNVASTYGGWIQLSSRCCPN